MIYGNYRKSRDASWECLKENGIKELPVDVWSIAAHNNIYIKRNSNVDILEKGEKGVTLLIDNEWYIVFDDSLEYTERHMTIAHELGHIFLGHMLVPIPDNGTLRTFHSRPIEEVEADMFAIRLLSPACVLWAMKVETAEEISRICGIPMEYAIKRRARMKVLVKRNKFLTSLLEKEVLNQFEKFIVNCKCDKT